jgi:hypothetical protein
MTSTRPTPTGTAPSSALPVVAAIGGWVVLLVVTAGRIRDEITATLFRDEAIAWTYADLPLRDIPEALGWDVNPRCTSSRCTPGSAAGTGDTYLRGAVGPGDARGRRCVVRRRPATGWSPRRVAGQRVRAAGPRKPRDWRDWPGPYAIAFLLGTIALDAAIALVQGRAVAGAGGVQRGRGPAAPHPLLGWAAAGGAARGARRRQPCVTRPARPAAANALVATGIALVGVPALGADAGRSARQLTPCGSPGARRRWLLGTDAHAVGRWAGHRVGRRARAGRALVSAARRRRREPAQTRPSPSTPGHLLLVTGMVLAAVAVVVLLWTVSQVRPLFTPNYAFVVMAPLGTRAGRASTCPDDGGRCRRARRPSHSSPLPDFSRSVFARSPVTAAGPGARGMPSRQPWRSATEPGDVVVTSPGRVLAIRYYLGADRDYVTPIGRVYHGRFDYRNRVERLRSDRRRCSSPTVSPDGLPGPRRGRSPDGIRTRATALRGRRARPLHNGAVLGARADRSAQRRRSYPTQRVGVKRRAGVPGLEPRLD